MSPARKSSVRYIVDPDTGCWLWQGAISTPKGYGTMYDSSQKRQRPAHRVFYERLVGPIPDGMQLDHVKARGCRHRHCVNPAHLEPVTNAQNSQRGGNAKLTPDAVRKIRASSEPSPRVAARLGVHPTLVQQVRAGQSWTNVV